MNKAQLFAALFAVLTLAGSSCSGGGGYGAIPVNGSPFPAGSAPWSLTDPSGKFVYVANASSSNISVYVIDASSGALTAVGGSPFAAGSLPYAVAVGH